MNVKRIKRFVAIGGVRQETVRRILLSGIAVAGLIGGCHLGSDTDPRPELTALYDFIYDEAETLFERDLRESGLEADRLARERIVNAANSLVDEARTNPADRYKIDLPHLNMPEEDPGWETPLHLRLTVTAEDLARLGVTSR